MLVISQNLVLTAAEDVLPDGTPIILYDNKVTSANVTADSEDSDYPAVNLANPATNQEWRGASDSPLPSTVLIDVDINSVDLVDAVGIARHNFGSAGIAVTILQVVPDSPGDEAILAGPQVPPDDEPLLFQFTATSFVTLRIQLDIDEEAPRAAVLYAGKALITERGFEIDRDFVVPPMGRKTDAINGRSERGDFLGRIITSQFIETEVSWKHFTASWYRTYFDPFVDAAQQDTPFFLAWSPDDYPYEVAYCWLTDDPTPTTSPVTGRITVGLKLGGILE